MNNVMRFTQYSNQKTVKILLILMLVSSVVLVGCAKKTSESNVNEQPQEVIGQTIDVTSKDQQTVSAKVNDLIYFKLEGQPATENQWYIVSPTSTTAVRLYDHKITDFMNKEASTYTDEWWIKVEQAGNFTIQAEYKKLNEAPEKTFTVMVEATN